MPYRKKAERIPRLQACRVLRWNGRHKLLKLLLVRMYHWWSEESRTEMRRHKCCKEVFDISAKEHSQSADTKHTTIAVWVQPEVAGGQQRCW